MMRSRWTPSSLLRRCSSYITHSLHTRWGVGQSSSEVGVILAYGLSALPLALLNNIWVTYNYPFFVGGPLRDSSLFIWVQVVFLLWNSVNDPLFGWISDHTPLGGGSGRKAGAAVPIHPSLRRIRHIRLGGYLLGAAFLFAWFPWSMTTPWVAATHFLISLCAYDGALTYMEVNHSSLLADISVNAQTRAWCNSASSLFSILGSLSSFAGHMLYTSSVSYSDSSSDSGSGGGMHHEGQAPWPFKLFCMALVGLCVPALEISCRYIDGWARNQPHHASAGGVGDGTHSSPPVVAMQERSSTSDRKGHRQHSGGESGSAAERGTLLGDSSDANSIVTENIVQVRVAPASPSLKSAGAPSSVSSASASQPSSPAASSSAASATAPLTFLLFLRQIASHRNFALFCGIRLLQVFLCTFEKNHLSSFLAVLLGAHLSQASQAALISLSFIMPHLLLLLTSVWQSQLGGVYSIIRGLFLTKVCAALITLATLVFVTSGTQGGIGSFASASASSEASSSASSLSWSFLPYLLVLYLCGSRVVTECVCRLIPLVTSGLVDEDRVLHLRPSSMAATLIGTSSLLAKPGESLAPMLGWKVINMIGAGGGGGAEDGAATAATGGEASEARKAGLLYLLLTLPLITVGIQLMLWSAFTLKGAYLRHISQRVKELEGVVANDDQEATLKISDEHEHNKLEA